MIIHEVESNPLEPVTLDEVKDFLGYDEGVKTHDDALMRHIKASRQMLERNLDIYITQRQVRFCPPPGPVDVPSPVVSVVSFKAVDEHGEEVDVEEYGLTGSELNRKLHWRMPEGCTDPTAILMVGFEECPEDIRAVIVDLVKARYDRAPVAPVMDDAIVTLHHYRRMSL